ncbi:MAG TPA: hypothetical protein VII14_09960 [Xanthobacteraceae bacterium]
MKLTIQIPSSTSSMPTRRPASTVEVLIFFRCRIKPASRRRHRLRPHLHVPDFWSRSWTPGLMRAFSITPASTFVTWGQIRWTEQARPRA